MVSSGCWGDERGAGEFWSAVRGCDMERAWILQVEMGAFECRLLASVVDVSVIFQLKFQQPFVEFYKVPQLQFIDRVVVISVVSQRQGSQCKLCKTGDSTVQFFAKVLTCPCCACRDSADKCELPAVAGIDKVVQFVLVGCPVPGQGCWHAGWCATSWVCLVVQQTAEPPQLQHIDKFGSRACRNATMVQTVQLGWT